MTDQLPPHSVYDEQGVLSCVLQDAELCLPDCASITQDCFYDAWSIEVWRAITAINQKAQPVNSVTVSQWMIQNSKIEGAVSKVVGLMEASPSPSALPAFLSKLLDFATRRSLIRGCTEISLQASDGHATESVLASAERLLSIQRPDAAQIHDGNAAGLKMIDDLERRHQLQGQLSGLDTGLIDLNRKTDGLQYGEQTLIAARPSIGKTAIGLGIFAHVIFVLGLPALFVSLEMSTSALMRRLLSSRTGVTMGEIRAGSYTEGVFTKMGGFRLAASKSPLHILDGAAGMGIGEVCSSVRRHVRRHGVKLVVVDYLQKIRATEKHEKRTYEVADVSGRLRSLAVETGAAFLTLAQLNREPEKDKPRTPRLSDLADSGQIERDADTIILLDRKRDEAHGEATLVVAKQRDGETGIVKVYFNGPLCRFENLSRISDADVPEQEAHD